MFNTGDSVVHPKHGSGVVAKRLNIEFNGDTREYFCIELSDGRGSVKIPLERLEEAGLREPMRDTRLIQQVMATTPEALVNDVHVRQSGIEAKMSSGDLELLLQALRDLAWRETVLHLSPVDKKLKEAALTKILQELALDRLQTMTTIRQDVEMIIGQAMQVHLAAMPEASQAESS